MGYVFTYEMWVPQERLTHFLELLNEFSAEEITFDSAASNEYFTTSLLFETDDVLSENKYHSYLNGKCNVLGIDALFDSSPENANWLDTEGENILVSFTGQTKSISFDMLTSPSIRREFTNLARDGGAISCTGNDEIIYLDRQEINEEWEGVEYPEYGYSHFRDIRHYLNPTQELSENEKKLQICQLSAELSQHDLMLRLDWAKNSEDSGVRAAAIKSIHVSLICLKWRGNKEESVRAAKIKAWSEIENPGVENLLGDIALKDESWKVRYVAAYCLGEFISGSSENVLSILVKDEHPKIRTIAAKILYEVRKGQLLN